MIVHHVENENTNVMDNEIDEAEVARDKLVNKVVAYAVPHLDIRQPAQDMVDIEQEIRKRLSSIGVDVSSIRHRTKSGGKHESSLVKLKPVNLNRIWSRRLGNQPKLKFLLFFRYITIWVELYDCSYAVLIIPVVAAGIFDPLRIQLNSAQLDPSITVQ